MKSSYFALIGNLARYTMMPGFKNRVRNLSITNETVLIDGENVGGSTAAPDAPEVAGDNGDGDGDGDSDPDRRLKHRTRSAIPPATASCGRTSSASASTSPSDLLALSVLQFCAQHSITKPHLYELWKRGQGPRFMKVGRRTLISIEAAADWRRQMEALTQQNHLSA